MKERQMSKKGIKYTSVTLSGLSTGGTILLPVLKDKEQERKRKEEILDGINQIKAASKRWERKHQLNFMDYLAKEYNRLEECRHKPVGTGYATQTVIMANISGNIEYFSIDLEGLQDLYYYIKNNLNSQSNNGANLRMR